MRPSAFFAIVFIVIFAFTAFAAIISDFGNYYPDVKVNTTWEGNFTYGERLNESGTKIQREIQNISEKTGFFSVVVGGAFAMARAVIEAFKLTIGGAAYAIGSIAFIGEQIGIPPFAIAIAVTVFIFALVFGILTILRRWRT